MNRLYGLDALRGIAAVMVMLLHANASFGGFDIFSRANLAVDLFFMLSGYVMARSYEHRMAGQETQFIITRVRRLWLPVAIGTTLGLFCLLHTRGPGPLLVIGYMLALLFLPTPGAHLFKYNVPAWSIFFELFANFIHATFLRKLSVRQLFVVASAAVTVTVVLSAPFGEFRAGTRPDGFPIAFFRVLGPYAIGIILFRLLGDRPLVKAPAALAPALLVGAVLVADLIDSIAFDTMVIVAVCPALIVLALNGGIRFSGELGALSFPLYAVHHPIFDWARALDMPTPLAIVLALCAALTVAVFTDPAIRQRVTVWGMRWTAG